MPRRNKKRSKNKPKHKKRPRAWHRRAKVPIWALQREIERGVLVGQGACHPEGSR
jgi:hypothetical protein